MTNQTAPRIIQSSAYSMYGVSLMSDGHMENVGIGSFDIDRSEEMACRLEAIANAIRANAIRANAALRSIVHFTPL